MDPFRDYRPIVPAPARHCPFGGCAVCCSHPVRVRREFAELVGRSWNPAALDLLRQAARAVLR